MGPRGLYAKGQEISAGGPADIPDILVMLRCFL